MSSVIRRVLKTPIHQLLAGRIAQPTEDWKQTILASGLPEELKSALKTLIRKTRLWKSEKAEVAEEMVSHFHDALKLGTNPAQALKEFGDLSNAAKLIRRAKFRSRPMSWHVYRNAVRGVVVMSAVYGGLFTYFLMGSPTITVDYLARYNANAVAVPEAERAWTYYKPLAGEIERRYLAVLTKDDPQMPGWQREELANKVESAEPGDEQWPKLVEHVRALAPVLETARRASELPQMGYVADLYMDTPEGRAMREQVKNRNDPQEGLFLYALLPHLSDLRQIANLLAQDARVALAEGDGARCEADLLALQRMARQLGTSDGLCVTQLTAIGILSLGMEGVEQALWRRPDVFSEPQWVKLTHELAWPAGVKISLASERLGMLDVIQRMYTDEGRGEGRLTRGAVLWSEHLRSMQGQPQGATADQNLTRLLMSPGAMTVASRKRTTDEAMRLFDMQESELAKPARLQDYTAFDTRFKEIIATPLSRLEYMPIPILMPSTHNLGKTVERCRARALSLQTAIALELFKRKTGKYPEALAELVPAYLPTHPQDPMTGEGMKYTLREGRPLLYSVGTDLKDDGGTPPVDRLGRPDNWRAAEFPPSHSSPPRLPGDWVLFPTPTISKR